MFSKSLDQLQKNKIAIEYFSTVTSHDETKAVPLLVQTDVNCLWYNPWGAVWCFEWGNINTQKDTQTQRESEIWGHKSYYYCSIFPYQSAFAVYLIKHN